jgi:hypothetical protein
MHTDALRTTGCSSWRRGRSAAARSGRSCDNRSRRGSQEYNPPHVLDLAALTVLAARVWTPTGWGNMR